MDRISVLPLSLSLSLSRFGDFVIPLFSSAIDFLSFSSAVHDWVKRKISATSLSLLCFLCLSLSLSLTTDSSFIYHLSLCLSHTLSHSYTPDVQTSVLKQFDTCQCLWLNMLPQVIHFLLQKTKEIHFFLFFPMIMALFWLLERRFFIKCQKFYSPKLCVIDHFMTDFVSSLESY